MAGEAPRAAEWASDEAAARTGQAIAAAAYATAKRAVDILVAVALLLLLAPVLAFIAGAILVEGGGPIFYRGERVGRDGRRFRVVKFRSMLAGCDEVAHRAGWRFRLSPNVMRVRTRVAGSNSTRWEDHTRCLLEALSGSKSRGVL